MKLALVAVVLLAPSVAFAHGGSYRGPGAQAPGGVPPGTADPPAPPTRWETWWAANKDQFLRLGEHMREVDGPTSRGASGDKPSGSKSEDSPEERRKKRDDAVREQLVPV